MDSACSTFKVPLAPLQPMRTTESLLFNDILEEKTVALRDRLNEFLQVQPYRKFNDEFATFMERTGRIIQESQRAGTNVSRLTNCSHVTQPYSRPSASFNYRPTASFNYRPSTTTVSMVSSNRGSAFRLPENNCQLIEPNPFKPPGNISYEPRVVLPRIDSSVYHSPQVTPSICATVIEVGQENVQMNDDRENCHSPNPNKNHLSTVENNYSDMTVIENKIDCSSQHDESNSIDQLLESVGFKIVVGLPDTNNTKNSQKSNASVQNNNNKLNRSENIEKFLSMWSVNMKQIKSNMKTSKFVVILTGDLIGEDRVTVVEKRHNAGILESRKENSLVKTKSGIYRLIGNIVGGSPNNLYSACLASNGIPRTWKSLVKQLSGAEKGPKNALMNFSLDSPAGPSKPTKLSVNLDISKTRKGTSYNKNGSTNIQKSNGKRKLAESNLNDNNKNSSKHRKFHEQLSPMMSSTPKRPSKPQHTMFETPSQILKNRFHQNVCNANSKPSVKSKNRVLQTINDSINITKKRRSYSKEQTENLKKGTLLKTTETTNNSTRHSKHSNVGNSINSSKQSKQSLKNSNSSVLNSVNSNSTRSKSNTVENSTSAINNNSSRQQSKHHKSSINSTKNNSTNSSQKSGRVNGSKRSITPMEKSASSINVTKAKQNTSNRISLTVTKPKVVPKNKKAITKEKNCIKLLKDKAMPKESKNGKEPGPSTFLGLFEDLEVADYDDDGMYDVNIMASPGKLSSVRHTDKSRSETPPLFNSQWSVTAKSLVTSEPPSPLSKSVEAKALKRIKAPTLNVEEEIKKNRRKMNKQSVDYKAVSNKINKMLEFGEHYNEDNN